MTEPQFDLVEPRERRGVSLCVCAGDSPSRSRCPGRASARASSIRPHGRQVCLSAFHLAGQLYFDGPVPRSLPRWRAWGHVDWSRGAWGASYAAQYVGGYSEQVNRLPRIGHCLRSHEEGGVGSVPRYRSRLRIRRRAFAARGGHNVTDEDPPFVENESNANTDATDTRCWGAPTSSSCAMHFGSSLGGCRHEARLRLEPREFRLNRLPE